MAVELKLSEFLGAARNSDHEPQRQGRTLACWLFSWVAFYSPKCSVNSEC